MKKPILASVGLFFLTMTVLSVAPASAQPSGSSARQACEMTLQNRVSAAPQILKADDEPPIVAVVPAALPVEASIENTGKGHIIQASLPVPAPAARVAALTTVPQPPAPAPRVDYTDVSILDAVRTALAASPNATLEQIREKAIKDYGIDGADFDRATRLFNPATARDPASGYTDAQVFTAIRQSITQNPGTSLDQIREKAVASFGITAGQFDRSIRSLIRPSGREQVVLSLGDSWIGGDNRDLFTDSLSGSTGFRVINRAQSGLTLADMVNRLDQDLSAVGGAEAVGAVVIHGGGNDFLAQISNTDATQSYLKTVEHLDQLVGRLAEKGIPVVISPAVMMTRDMVARDPKDPVKLTFNERSSFAVDPMYAAIAARWPNVSVASGYTVAQMMKEQTNVLNGLFPDRMATDRLAVAVGQTVRVATSY